MIYFVSPRLCSPPLWRVEVFRKKMCCFACCQICCNRSSRRWLGGVRFMRWAAVLISALRCEDPAPCWCWWWDATIQRYQTGPLQYSTYSDYSTEPNPGTYNTYPNIPNWSEFHSFAPSPVAPNPWPLLDTSVKREVWLKFLIFVTKFCFLSFL